MQNAFGAAEVAFGSNESANGSAIKVVAIFGKSELKLVNFAVDVLTPSFRNGRVKSSFFFELFKLTKEIV